MTSALKEKEGEKIFLDFFSTVFLLLSSTSKISEDDVDQSEESCP